MHYDVVAHALDSLKEALRQGIRLPKHALALPAVELGQHTVEVDADGLLGQVSYYLI
jgi:hypothetical protein